MNRSFKEFAQSNHQQRRRVTGNSDEDFHPLDLFSRNRPRVSLDNSDRAASLRLGKISVGSVRSVKSGLDDLLTSADSGKHDYDWLLTPPETPLFTPAEGNEIQQSFTTPRRSSAARSVSTSKPSRLSSTRVVGVESNVSTRPARSSSVTRSSVSYSQTNTTTSYYSSIRSSTSLLNTSSASVSSYIRPSSPITRSSSTARPSTPSTRTTPSRSSTPSRARSAPTLSSTDKPRPSYGSRPSSPSPRPQILNSRSSTPTRRSPITSSLSPGPNNIIPSLSVRSLSNNGRSQNSGSRPSSPNPSRVRSQQPVIPPDFSHDTPPNLRTTMPDRPVSAGRSRPVTNGATTAAKGNTDSQGHGSFTRRSSSPIVTRGRSVEPKGRTHILHSNGYSSEIQEPRRSSYVPESPSRRNVRVPPSAATADSNAYGRTISKKSLDMAKKHMDIRDGSGSMRPLGGTVRYPQSIRSASSKIHASPTLSNSGSGGLSGRLSTSISNGYLQRSESGKYNEKGAHENGRRREDNGRSLIERLSEVDMFESSRYDAILLKEDLKNTNWLLSADEKSDQGLIFDPGNITYHMRNKKQPMLPSTFHCKGFMTPSPRQMRAFYMAFNEVLITLLYKYLIVENEVTS
ncbi:hypothetical protein V2J09_007080 [Rumex salicifolius]